MSRTITSHGTVGITLTSPSDNPVTVAANASIVTSGSYALYGTAGVAWTISNEGKLSASGDGITLAGGGSVTNGSTSDTTASIKGNIGVAIEGGGGAVANSGQIYGQMVGVQIGGGAGIVSNFGSISGAAEAGVVLDEGGSVVNGSNTDNSASIIGGINGVQSYDAAATITNYGSILGGPASGNGGAIYLAAGGSVTNGSSLDITARVQGIYVTGGAGAVTNSGSITGYTHGVDLSNGGTITNLGTIEGSSVGVLIGAYTGSGVNPGPGVTNSGQIYSQGGYAVELTAGGSVTNESGGSIYGQDGGVVVQGAAGTITNFGLILDDGIRGNGVFLADGGEVVNGSATATRVEIGAASGLAVDIAGGPGVVVNYGDLAGSYGLDLQDGGSFTNGSSTVTDAVSAAVLIDGGGTVTNYGIIYGITMTGAGTVTNAGTINGGNALFSTILFSGGNDRLIVDPGAVFLGSGVTASSGASNVLELASGSTAGQISGLGQEFLNFGTVALDPHGDWSLGGVNTLANGSTLSTGAGSKLTVTGSLVAAGELFLSGKGKLIVAPGGLAEVGTAGGDKLGKATVDADGTLAGAGQVRGGVVDNGLIVAQGGTLTVSGAVSGSGTVAIDPQAVFWVGRALAAAVEFLPLGGTGHETVAVAQAGSVTAVFSGFVHGDTIDLVGQVVTGISYASSTGILTVQDAGATVASLHFSGSYTNESFGFRGDGHTGTYLTAR